MIKVLIVDDRSIIRKSIRAMSCWENNEMSIVGEAANGLEAIKLINDLSPHIVITDVKMPLMDGIELSKHIYEHFDNSIRTIILSAYDEFGYAQQAIKYGVSEYLLKPLKQEELVDAILNIKEKILNAQMASQDLRKSTDKEVIKEVKTVVDLAKEIVNEQYFRKDLTLNRLCQKLFINKSYFCQIFKAETGETLTSYITRKRLSKAMELLKASNLKIYEVADRVGFSNQYYFSNVFSKYYGFSPKYVKKIK